MLDTGFVTVNPRLAQNSNNKAPLGFWILQTAVWRIGVSKRQTFPLFLQEEL